MRGPTIAPTLEETLSPDWLTAALGTRYPGVRVVDVTVGEVVSRMSTNARFTIQTADELPADLSSALCVKGYFAEYGQGPLVVGLNETLFYRDAVEAIGVRSLRTRYADADPVTQACVLITDDVIAAGARFLEPADPYTIDDAAASLEQLAKLHIATWMEPRYGSATWLDPWFEVLGTVRGVKEIDANFESPIGAGVPEAVRSAERLCAGRRLAAVDATRAEPWCVVHGDPHAANLLRDVDGLPTLVDWQLVQRGPWYLDVGYHLGSVLGVEDRRANEDDLLRHYLEHLRAAGLPVPALDEAWRLLCRGLVYGFFLWGITLVVKPEITTVLLERLGHAVDDHGALDVVEALA